MRQQDQRDQAFLERLLRGFGAGISEGFAADARAMTSRLYPYERMFSPITLNRLALRNRLVMAPMGNLGMIDGQGRPTAKMIAYFEARARGGVGLIISGLVPVSPASDPSIPQPDGGAFLPRIGGARSRFSGWRDLAACVHAHGARFFIQLTAGLGRVGSPECVRERWRLPVSASWNPNFYVPQIPCRPLSDYACRKIIRDAGQVAADARMCGIDGVQLHGHEGYLLEQFANTAFNRRVLGRYRDWQAFGCDMVREIRERCGADYPIIYRMDLSLALRATYAERLDSVRPLRRFRAERSLSESLSYVRELVKAGIDAVDVDLGCYENWWLPHPPGPMPPGVFLEVARWLCDALRRASVLSNAGQPVTVIAIGKLGYPDVAERALRDGACDMVMLGRPLLADPEWPNKVYAGAVHDIVPCIGDHEACLKEIIEGGHIQCAVNPRTGFEERLPAKPVRTARPKRVAVIGAGPAGLTCAFLASQRGHQVVLFEKTSRPGGWLRAGSAPAIKFDVANYLSHLEYRLERLAGEAGLEVRLSTEATCEVLADECFDVVVCANGSRPVTPRYEPGEAGGAVLATDLLLNPGLAEGARHVLVVGGGDVGCETAHMLAAESGKTVTVVEIAAHFMPGSCQANRGYLIHHLEKLGVTLLNGARLARIGDGVVRVRRNVSAGLPSPYVTWTPLLPANVRSPFAASIDVVEEEIELPADLVVFATGLKPRSELYRACVDRRVAPVVQAIGDCFKVGRIFDATKAGYAVGATL